ncbi:hypothetical protein, partial [Pseudomonas aeruginosa]|uniref:hypothetical protein n=1 Tax=Pseudomonas aeruginosa TaxID=287 RepID=UPI0031B6C256
MSCTVKEIIRDVLDTDVPDSECVFAVVLVRTDPATERLILTAAQLDALKCHAGDRVRLVRLCAEEKTA